MPELTFKQLFLSFLRIFFIFKYGSLLYVYLALFFICNEDAKKHMVLLIVTGYRSV